MVDWYKGMKQKMTRLHFERALFMDEPMDNTASEIYLEHVRDLMKAYSLIGTLSAAERKMAIITLWRAGNARTLAPCTHACTHLHARRPHARRSGCLRDALLTT